MTSKEFQFVKAGEIADVQRQPIRGELHRMVWTEGQGSSYVSILEHGAWSTVDTIGLCSSHSDIRLRVVRTGTVSAGPMVLRLGPCPLCSMGPDRLHTRDMSNPRKQCPDIYEHFMCDAFSSNKTGNLYSAIGLDHAHEQMNGHVKGDGGAIGPTEDPGALRRWMVPGPHHTGVRGGLRQVACRYQHKTSRAEHLSANSRRRWCAFPCRSAGWTGKPVPGLY